MHQLDYNTQRGDIRLKEYGRSVQDMVSSVLEMTDPAERLEKAKSIIKLMKIMNPGYKDNHENEQMMWDHLHIIADFKLEVENSGFTKPEPEEMMKKPEKVAYGTGRIRLKHYGKNIERLVEKLATEPDPDRQMAGVSKAGKMMKKFYADFNSDTLEDDVIASQIEDISKGKLKVNRQLVEQENLFYVSKAELLSDNNQNNKTKARQNNNNNNNKNFKKKKKK